MKRKLTSVGRPNYKEAALQQRPALRMGEGNSDNPQIGAEGLDMVREATKKVETSTALLEAAKKVLRQNGYAALSTRACGISGVGSAARSSSPRP